MKIAETIEMGNLPWATGGPRGAERVNGAKKTIGHLRPREKMQIRDRSTVRSFFPRSPPLFIDRNCR